MKATADQLNTWAGQYDESTVPGSIVLPAARWWEVQKALQELADLRRGTGKAKDIVAAVCAQHENPFLRADSPFILAAFDEVLTSLKPAPELVAPPAPTPKAAEVSKPASAALPAPQPVKEQPIPHV